MDTVDRGAFISNFGKNSPVYCFKDGKGIGMVRWEGDDGAWHWYFEDSISKLQKYFEV